jgi:hypothetical protein
MAKTEPKKRKLKFSSLDDMMAEVRSLKQNGYLSNGNWTLGQCCGHIAAWMSYPLDGFPVPPLAVRMMFWVMKKTVVPGMKRKILAEGFKGGTMTAPESVPKQDETSDQMGIEQLQKAVDRVNAHEGSLHPSPLFGEMDKAMHIKVSLLHAEHHLGYLEPKQA